MDVFSGRPSKKKLANRRGAGGEVIREVSFSGHFSVLIKLFIIEIHAVIEAVKVP